MQLLITLLLSLSAGALALPTTTTTDDKHNNSIFTGNATLPLAPHSLQPRGNFGWISSWAPSDTHCAHGYDTRSRPKLEGACQIWNPSTDNVGINFGTYPLSIMYVALYSDLRCKNEVQRIEPDAGRNLGWTTHANKGVNVCAKVDRGKVYSVMGWGIGDEDPLGD